MNDHILHDENVSNNDQLHEVKKEQALRRSTRMSRSAISNRFFFCLQQTSVLSLKLEVVWESRP